MSDLARLFQIFHPNVGAGVYDVRHRIGGEKSVVEIKFNKDFGKVPRHKANTANRNIQKTMESNKTLDQKVNAIVREFNTAYKSTGLENFGDTLKDTIKKMVKDGGAPRQYAHTLYKQLDKLFSLVLGQRSSCSHKTLPASRYRISQSTNGE